MKIGDSKKVNTAEKQKVSEKIQMMQMQQKSTEENRQKRSKSKMELRNSA